MIRGLALYLLLTTMQSEPVAQSYRPVQVGDNRQRIQRAELRPDMAANFDDVAALKIASRKSVFQLGEMIMLDVALLNTTSRPVFFRKLSELRLTVLNSAGQPVAVQEYGVADKAWITTSFVQLAPGEMIVRSFQLLAGCDERAFAQFATPVDDERTVFRKGLFLNWGDACLLATKSEAYTVSVELKNSFVLVSEGTRRTKTAVGAAKSNSVEINIGNQ